MQIVLDKLISDHVYFDTLLTDPDPDPDPGHEIEQLATNFPAFA